jgi:hypothetical protein
MTDSVTSGVPGQPRTWTLPDFQRPESIETSSADDFGRPLESYLPSPIRFAWATISGAIQAGVDLLVPDEGDTPDGAGITAPLDRAKEAQRALTDEHAMLGTPDRFPGDGLRVWRAAVWGLGQVLHGRIILAMQGGDWERVDGIFRELESYRQGDGFVGGINSNERYYDDNEWIGLAAMQAYDATGDEKYLRHAERTFRFVRSGQHDQGGLYWLEQDKVARHTCSMGPGGELAMQLYEATGREEYLEFGKEQAAALAATTRRDDHLYGDSRNDNGSFDPTVYSYNQGTPIGLDVMLFKATGERRYLDRAKQSADAALRYYAEGDRLWKQPPCFNAIYFRNLLALQAISPDPRILAQLDGYLDKVWREARNPETGLFDQGGIGKYGDEPGNVLDQGALSQLYAIRALPREQWATLA